MNKLKLDGKMDHLSYRFSSQNVSSYAMCSFKTANNSFKCMDILSFGIKHKIWQLIHTSSHHWRLSIARQNKRSVFLNFGLSDNAEKRVTFTIWIEYCFRYTTIKNDFYWWWRGYVFSNQVISEEWIDISSAFCISYFWS